MVIQMEYRITTRSVEDTMEIAQNIESEKFPNMINATLSYGCISSRW